MSKVTLIPRRTSPHADGIQIRFEASPIGPGLFKPQQPTPNSDISMIVAGAEAFKVSATEVALSGACLLGNPNEDRYEILSGRLVIDKKDSGWPDPIKNYLADNWFEDLTVVAIAIGNDGLQLEVDHGGKTRIFRWSPVRVTADPSVVRVRWQELTDTAQSISLLDTELDTVGIRLARLKDAPSREGAVVVERYLQRTQRTDLVPLSKLTIERPGFGLHLLGRDWFPETCWSWGDVDNEIFEFVDIAAGDWEPDAELDAELDGKLTATATKATTDAPKGLQITKMPPLLTTGRTADDTSELPAAWQYATIKSNGGGTAAGVWVHWNLSLSDVPSLLAVQSASLDSNLHGLWAINQLDWSFEIGLKPQQASDQPVARDRQGPPRIRLRLTKKTTTSEWSATLAISDPQVFARSPELQFFGRSMLDASALPHAPELALSLTTARVEFANIEFKDPAKMQVSANLADGAIKFQAGPQAVEAWVPGPWAGLNDVSLTGANLPADVPSSEDPIKLVRDRNQGLVDLPLGEFSLTVAEDALAQIAFETRPSSERTGPTVATLLPWATWSVTNANTHLDIYHRNLQLEHFEHQQTQRPKGPESFPKSDGIMLPPSNPMSAPAESQQPVPVDSDFLLRVEMEYDRVRALRDRFARAAAPIEATSGDSVDVKNWFHPQLGAKVRVDRPAELDTPPKLYWTITGLPTAALEVGSRENILEVGLEWAGAVVPDDATLSTPNISVTAAKDGLRKAEFLASNGHVSPVFRTAAIRCLDAAEVGLSEIGQTLLVVYVDEADRTFAWFPSFWKEPRQLTDVTGKLNQIRIVLTEPGDESNRLMFAAIESGKAKIWACRVRRDDEDLPVIESAQNVVLAEMNVTALHSSIAQVDTKPNPILLVGTNEGVITAYSREILQKSLVDSTAPGAGVRTMTVTFGGKPIERMDFRNQASQTPKTQTLLAGARDGSKHLILVAIWGNDLADPDLKLFSSEDGIADEKKCPRLVVADNTEILGMALQGFHAPEPGQTKDTLYVWGIVKDNNVTRTCQWKLSLHAAASTPELLLIQTPETSAETITGFLPPNQALLGDVSQLAFGDRTEVASRFLVAVTAAGAGQSSCWARWEPDWDLRQDSVPAKSFFQVPAHCGRVTGASVVPRLNASVVLATGGDDGAVIVWDVESGQELYRWLPRDWFIDGLGGVRLAAPKGKSKKGFYAEKLSLPHVALDREFIVLSTSPMDGAGAVPHVLTTAGADLNLVCNSLLLIRNGSTNRWTIASADPRIATPLGTIGVYKKNENEGDPDSISNWPRIGGHPFYPIDATFTFDDDPLDDPQPKEIEITGVLLNPADLQDVVASTATPDPSQPDKRVNLFGQAPWFVHHSNQEIRVTLKRIDTADEAYDVAGVTGTFDWTFPLADQIPPPSVDRSVPGRLSSLSGDVSWDSLTSSLLLSVKGENSLADALGREWSLTQPIDLKLERSDPRQLLIRESLPDSSATLLARRTLPHLSDGSQTSVIEQGRGPNGELLALTASDAQKAPGDLFVSEVDTGRRILHCQDRYRDGVLTLRGSSDPDAQPIDAVLVHVDGTVRVWPALSSKINSSGGFEFESLLPQAERRRLQPDSSVEAVVVFDGLDKPNETASPGQHHRLYLLRCADGSARLWDDQEGEVWRFDLPDTIVTAIAIAPSLGTIPFDKFAALQPTKFGGPRPINQVLDAVTTVIALGGADGSVRCFLIERELPKLSVPSAPPICFYEHPRLSAEVTSLSLAFDPKAVLLNSILSPGLFVLPCCRSGEETSLTEILSDPKPQLKLRARRARLATSNDSLFIAAELVTESGIEVKIYEKDGIAEVESAAVTGSSQLSTLALCKVESSKAIFAADGKELSFAKIDTPNAPIVLSTIVTEDARGQQALSLINVQAGNALLAIDSHGQARLFSETQDTSPVWKTGVQAFAPQDSQKVVAATFADTIVPVALRVADSRIEVWDLDFDSRRWVSPAEIGTFTPNDLPAVCFQFVNGRPILAVGRVGFVEFWNLSNRQLERQMACGGTVNRLDLKVDELGEPQVLIGLKDSQVILSGLADKLPKDVTNEYHQKFVRGTTAKLAVALERQKNKTNPAEEKLCVTYWENSTTPNPIQIFISPGEEGRKILHFDAVHFEKSTTIVVVVNLTAGATSWVFDSNADNAAAQAKKALGWMILDSKGNGKPANSDVNAETETQTLEAKPDRTVSRVFTNHKWTTTETIGGDPADILVREHHTGVEPNPRLPLQNLRLSEANWPVVAAISTASNIRLWDRLSGVLRQTWSANIAVDGNSESLKPLAKGLLGISSGTDPSLLVAGEQGLLLYRFRTGEFALPRPQSMKQVALAWEPTAEAFPLAAAWNNTGDNTTCCAATLAGFIKSPNSITAETAGLTSLTLSWQPEWTEGNRWHLSGSTGPTSSVYALDNPADATKAKLLDSLPGSILAMAWPTALDQGPVRVINTLRPDRGPRRDVSRLLLAVDYSGTLELQEAILPDTGSQGLTIVAKWATAKESGNSAVLALVDDDLGVRLVASALNVENKGATVMVPTPWLRISSTGAPQFDLQVKLPNQTPTDLTFLGRITRYRHFELDILKGPTLEVNMTLVARPALVQGDAFTFNVEPVANDSSKFLHGAMVLWETGDINPSAGLQGTLIWETCETSTPVTFDFDGSDIQNVKADTRTLTTVTILKSQFQTPHSYVTGVIHHDQEPRWELHIAEQPNGAAFAFLFQADLQGFVPVQIERVSAAWSITVSKTLFASAELTAAEGSGSSTPQVRDDVFLPLSKDDGSLALSSGQVVDLVDSSIVVLTSAGFGVLSMDNTKGFVFQTLKSTSDVPLDLIGGIDSTIAIPKQAIDVPQLVHRRDLGGRLRAARNGFEPLSLDVGDLLDPVVHRRISPVMTDDTRAAVLFESLTIRPSSPAPSNSVGLSVMRTESVMVLTCPEFLDPGKTQAVDIARNLLTATTSSSIGSGSPSEIFNDEAIRSHAIQVGSTGILLKRTLDTKGQIQFTFVNSPYHALEPQTLAGNRVSESVPNSDTPRRSTSPQWLSPSDAARLQLMAATKRFELTRPKTDLAKTRTLRFTASQALIPPLNQQNQRWRVAVAEHTLFDDFDSIDEDESQSVPETADGKIFLPTDLTLHYGVDKPGAAQVHQLRAVLPDNDDRFARTQPTLATLREPQQIQTPTDQTPTDSKLEIVSAVTTVDQTVVPGVTSLLINWKETIGSEPIGELATTIQIKPKEGNNDEYVILPFNDQDVAAATLLPVAVFERIGERLAAVLPNDPVLMTVDSTAAANALQRLSIFLVSKFDLSSTITSADGIGFTAQILIKKSSAPEPTLEPLTDYFDVIKTSDGTYFIATSNGSTMLNDLKDAKSWNIVWAPTSGSPDDIAKQAVKIFKSDGTVRFMDPSELRAARLAAVWRCPDKDLFGNTFLEQTLFYGESASSQRVTPEISQTSSGKYFELIANGIEEIGMAKSLIQGVQGARHLFLVKTLGNGETLKAGKSLP
jgi:WD40 repeat protein